MIIKKEPIRALSPEWRSATIPMKVIQMSYNYLHNINVSLEGIKGIAFEQIKELSKSTKTMKKKDNGLLKTFGNESLNNIFSDLNIDRLEIGG